MLASSEQGSFLVQILDRQHESWQGVITWLADGRKKTFKSLLEFITIVEREMESGRSEIETFMSMTAEDAIPKCGGKQKKDCAANSQQGHIETAAPVKMLMKTG